MSDVFPVIAIVDDDQAMREALFDLLQVAGFSARAFDSAAAFLSDFAQNSVDLLITDVRMPGMDGLQLQQRLSALAPSLPIIFVTGSSDPDTKGRAMAAGAFAYLNKPVGDEALLGALRGALGDGSAASQPAPDEG